MLKSASHPISRKFAKRMSKARALFSLTTVRTAANTNRALSVRPAPYPGYVNKWTREQQLYARSDLSLPASLYLCGQGPDNRPTVGVGGTRSPAVETFCLVSQVVSVLARKGIAVISGGVPGVDLAAHMAAIDARGGRTYAVMANPAENGLSGHEWSNRGLENALVRSGGFLSEYDFEVEINSEEYRRRLLDRDRIISGLCDTFLAFECSEYSATVDTAKRAIVQGKSVLCIRAAKTTSRRGLDQLVAQEGLQLLDEAEYGPLAIAEEVASRMDMTNRRL